MTFQGREYDDEAPEYDEQEDDYED